MAKRIKSAMKRVEVAKRNQQRNVVVKTTIKTYTKKVVEALNRNEIDNAQNELVLDAISKIDKAVSKGVIHKNTAARKKSRLMKKINNALTVKA